MTDVNAVDLTQETLATLDGTEQIIMFDTAEGKRATVSAVGDYILKKLATLDSQTAQTVINNLISRVTTLEGYNAFAEVMIGSTQIEADSAEDYLTLEAGTGITLTPDVANDKVTIGTSLTKSNVGLGNVDNTADAVKEVAYADDAGTVNEHTVLTDVPANAVFTDTTYDDVIGDTPMGTTATTITGAIAEHEQDIVDLNNQHVIETLSLTSSYVANIFAEKYGKVVSITLNNMKSVPNGQSITLFTLPTGWRPNHVCMWLLRNPTDTALLRITINADGTVVIYNYGSSATAESSNATQTCTFIAS